MASILLIEDVAIVRTVLRRFLESAGHRVTECEGGASASLVVSRERFDAVVTDLCMKDGDGWEFIRRQRASGDTSPIIAMTSGTPSLAESRAAAQALRAGASHVLLKPVKQTDILGAIGTMVKG